MLIEQMNRLERMEYERLENGIADVEGHTSSTNGMQPPNAHCHDTNTTEREVSILLISKLFLWSERKSGIVFI